MRAIVESKSMADHVEVLKVSKQYLNELSEKLKWSLSDPNMHKGIFIYTEIS
jgi:hypothetical protein